VDVGEFVGDCASTRQSLAEEQGAALVQFHIDLQTQTADFLANLAEQRQIQTTALQNALQIYHAQLRQATHNFLSQRGVDRQEQAARLREELQGFHDQIRLAVWGLVEPVNIATTAYVAEVFNGAETLVNEALAGVFDSISEPASDPEPIPAAPTDLDPTGLELPEEPLASAPDPDESVETAPPALEVLASMAKVVTPVSLPPALVVSTVSSPIVLMPDVDPTGQIVEFVTRYIEEQQQIIPGSTLLKVVGDRDLVRELLTRGAVEMGVDPSDILNVLRRMVAMSPLPV